MILFSYVSLLVFGLLDNFRGPFFSSQLNDFAIGETAGAALFGLTSIFASTASFLGGRLREWLGIQRLFNLGSLSMALGYVTMGSSSTIAVMWLGAALFGVGLGVATVAQNVAVAEHSPENRRGQYLSGLHAMYGLASMLAPTLAYQALSADWTWRQSYLMIAVLPGALLLSGLVWRKLRPEKATYHHDKSQPAKSKSLAGQRVAIFIVGLAMAIYLLAEISVGTRWVRWLEVQHGYSAAAGSLQLTWFFSALLLGRLVTWWWAPSSAKGLLRALLLSLAFGAIGLVVSWLYQPQWIVLSGLGMGPFYPLSIAYVRARWPEHLSQALSLVLGMGSATVVVMHFSIGLGADLFGLHRAMGIGPIGLFGAALLLFFEARKKI